jgi:predicted dehydrogenase
MNNQREIMPNLKVAVVGCGYWGQNLLRNFCELEEAEVVIACDFDSRALVRAKRRYPTLEVSQNYKDVLADPRVEAVVLATPVSTHYPFAQQALQAGKHVLVEKPLAQTSREVQDLIQLAERMGKTLMVDHTFLYTGAVRRMKQLVDSGEIGDLLYFDSVRISLGLVQSDINVLWDLGPHDLSIMDYLCNREPISISATGVNHLETPYQNIAYVTVQFAGNLIAHFHLNWLAPVKVRRTLVGGSKKMIVYDDMENSEKVRVYDKGITQNHDPERREKMLTGYRNGDMLAPNLEGTEALRLMAREFVTSIAEKRAPLSDGYAGLRIVRMLEAAQASIEQNGRVIYMKEPTHERPVVTTLPALAVQYSGGSHAGILSDRS